ncbi:DUF547 domain-containing protein [Sphingobacteriales bacterium CHB3]|nr:DUF547 domain-containing protein [Sphingobacteriales bacterium CHB3]
MRQIGTRLLILILNGILFVAAENVPAQPNHRHGLFSEILSYVHDGVVNYKEMRFDKRLAEYIGWLAKTDPDTLPGVNEKRAFWINTDNAYTLKVVCDNFPVESINDLHSGGLIIGSVLKTTVWAKIFSWYDSDFGSSDEKVLQSVARFLPDSLSRQILQNPREWKISYKSYDWSLNGY